MIAALFLAVVVEYVSLPLWIDLPLSYYLSFNALTLYVNLAVALLMIIYPTHLMRKLRETLEDLKSGGIISKEAADDVMRKTSRKIYGSKEKYLPPLLAVVPIIFLISWELSIGTLGVFDITDISGNVVCIWSFPFTLIHDALLNVELFILLMLIFSTLLVMWEVSRSISLMGTHVEIRIVSPGGTGGLSPIGKLMAEVVLLAIAIPTIYAVLCAAYFMITGMLYSAMGVAVILAYTLISALIPPPLLAIHRVMAERKEEALNQITHKIETLRRQVTLRDVGNASSEMTALSSLLIMLGEVRRMHTIPLKASSVPKVIVLISTPLLACLSVFLERYVGSPFGFLALGAIGVLSIASRFV